MIHSVKYKCNYTSEEGVSCPIMWSHDKPHPNYCHAYDTSIWRINPKLTCRDCVPLEDGEKPEKKIWCDQMYCCDAYNDGGVEKCIGCPAGTVVFQPKKRTFTKKDIKVLYDLLEGFHSYTCDDEDEKLWESACKVIDKLELANKWGEL